MKVCLTITCNEKAEPGYTEFEMDAERTKISVACMRTPFVTPSTKYWFYAEVEHEGVRQAIEFPARTIPDGRRMLAERIKVSFDVGQASRGLRRAKFIHTRDYDFEQSVPRTPKQDPIVEDGDIIGFVTIWTNDDKVGVVFNAIPFLNKPQRTVVFKRSEVAALAIENHRQDWRLAKEKQKHVCTEIDV